MTRRCAVQDKICTDGNCFHGCIKMMPPDDHINDVLDGEDRDLEDEIDCSMGPDGLCSNAGTEYCDLECPFRDRN